MAEPLETNSLELHMAFHNAVSRFQDWTANVAEPKVRLRGKFCPISRTDYANGSQSRSLPTSRAFKRSNFLPFSDMSSDPLGPESLW